MIIFFLCGAICFAFIGVLLFVHSCETKMHAIAGAVNTLILAKCICPSLEELIIAQNRIAALIFVLCSVSFGLMASCIIGCLIKLIIISIIGVSKLGKKHITIGNIIVGPICILFGVYMLLGITTILSECGLIACYSGAIWFMVAELSMLMRDKNRETKVK